MIKLKKTTKILTSIGIMVFMTSSSFGYGMFYKNEKGYFHHEEATACSSKEQKQLEYELYMTLNFDGRDNPVVLASEYEAGNVAHAKRTKKTNGVVQVTRSNCKLFLEGYLSMVEEDTESAIMYAEGYDYKIVNDYNTGGRTLDYALINLFTPDPGGEMVINDESPSVFYSKFDKYVTNREPTAPSTTTKYIVVDKKPTTEVKEIKDSMDSLNSEDRNMAMSLIESYEKMSKKNKNLELTSKELVRLIKKNTISGSDKYTSPVIGGLLVDYDCTVTELLNNAGTYTLGCEAKKGMNFWFQTRKVDEVVDYEVGTTYKISGRLFSSMYIDELSGVLSILFLEKKKQKKPWYKF